MVFVHFFGNTTNAGSDPQSWEENNVQDEQIKAVLAKIIETVDKLTDETAELVDKYHRRFELAPDFYHVAADRSRALSEAARNMRQAASTLLGIPDRQANQEGALGDFRE